MELLQFVSRWTHITLGTIGLVAFWFPVFARKGGHVHRRAGTVFVWCGYGVAGSAGLSCVLYARRILADGAIDQHRNTLAQLVFLGYLALVTFVMLRYAVGVLRTKNDPTQLATLQFRLLAATALGASAAAVAFGIVFPSRWSILLFALSPIGLGVGVPMLRYMRGAIEGPRAWWFEHMGATLSAGIGFHTAFAVFGLQRIIDLSNGGWLAVVPWVLPAIVGTPGLVLWKRHYRRKFQRSIGSSAVPVSQAGRRQAHPATAATPAPAPR